MRSVLQKRRRGTQYHGEPLRQGCNNRIPLADGALGAVYKAKALIFNVQLGQLALEGDLARRHELEHLTEDVWQLVVAGEG